MSFLANFMCLFFGVCQISVDVTEGELIGKRINSVEQFLGVPYAALPVGDLRWQ